MRFPDDSAKMIAPSAAMEKRYAESAVEFVRQASDGRVGYVGTVRGDQPFATGRASTAFRNWATQNWESLLPVAPGDS